MFSFEFPEELERPSICWNSSGSTKAAAALRRPLLRPAEAAGVRHGADERAQDRLLLDEPTAGINPTLINGLIDRLKRANEEFGITLFVIEHNMRVIMNMAERIYCLAHGELLAEGTPDQIQNDQRVIDAYLGAH